MSLIHWWQLTKDGNDYGAEGSKNIFYFDTNPNASSSFASSINRNCSRLGYGLQAKESTAVLAEVYADAAILSDFDFSTISSSSYTISFWLRPDAHESSAPTTQYVLSAVKGSTVVPIISLTRGSGKYTDISVPGTVSNSTTGNAVYFPGQFNNGDAISLTDGTDYLITYIVDGANAKLYVNNVLLRYLTYSNPTTSSGYQLNIAGYKNHELSSASLVDLRVYDKPISKKEMRNIYRAKILHWDFNNPSFATTNIIYDSSSCGRNGNCIASAGIGIIGSTCAIGGNIIFTGSGYFEFNSTNATVMCWIKTNNANNTTIDAGSSSYNEIDYTHNINVFSSTDNIYLFRTVEPTSSTGSSTYNITYAGVGTPTIYVDGFEATAANLCDGNWHFLAATNVNLSSWSKFCFNNVSTYRRSELFLSDVKIFNQTLTAEEIEEEYLSRVQFSDEYEIYANSFVEESSGLTTKTFINSTGCVKATSMTEDTSVDNISLKNDLTISAAELNEE